MEAPGVRQGFELEDTAKVLRVKLLELTAHLRLSILGPSPYLAAARLPK